MSFLSFFKCHSKTPTTQETPKEDLLASVGVFNSYDAEYRERRIASILEHADDSDTDKIRIVLDKWEITHWVDHDGSESWLPCPVWDDEGPLTRESFLSRSEALAHVERLGGSLLEDMPTAE